jgi:hypothetical protein
VTKFVDLMLISSLHELSSTFCPSVCLYVCVFVGFSSLHKSVCFCLSSALSFCLSFTLLFHLKYCNYSLFVVFLCLRRFFIRLFFLSLNPILPSVSILAKTLIRFFVFLLGQYYFSVYISIFFVASICLCIFLLFHQ